MGQVKGAEATNIMHSSAEMTPHKSHRLKARVACYGGSLMLPGPHVEVGNDD